jgi:hypothetical protein
MLYVVLDGAAAAHIITESHSRFGPSETEIRSRQVKLWDAQTSAGLRTFEGCRRGA